MLESVYYVSEMHRVEDESMGVGEGYHVCESYGDVLELLESWADHGIDVTEVHIAQVDAAIASERFFYELEQEL